MIVRHFTEVKQDKVTGEATKGVKIRWLITKPEGAPHFAMREFEVEPGGHTPYHSHHWEHEVFVLSGEGAVGSEDGDIPIVGGTTVFVPGGEMHNFKNTGTETLRFLCLIPHVDD